MATRVKICGITSLKDALLACDLGADALGFVFYAPSPRYISPVQANAIVAKLPPFITPIALFVDASQSQIHDVLSGSSRWQIQFHGQESNAFCQSFSTSFIKALRVQEGSNLVEQMGQYPQAAAILLDSYKPGVPGGTGESFNWGLIPADRIKPLILAGGLTPDNVQQAIIQVKPYAVDVSGGVEQSKGVKDPHKLEQFITGVRCG